jgi:hypothetical protein
VKSRPVPWPHICTTTLHRENPAIVLPTKAVSVHLSRSHNLLAKNEAGSPKLGASTLARKLASVELRERKIRVK